MMHHSRNANEIISILESSKKGNPKFEESKKVQKEVLSLLEGIILKSKSNGIMDFTLNKYLEILTELIRCGYEFQTFASFIKNPKTKAVILRHDVDLLPKNSLAFARLQSERNIHGVYYFRSVPQSWNGKHNKRNK